MMALPVQLALGRQNSAGRCDKTAELRLCEYNGGERTAKSDMRSYASLRPVTTDARPDAIGAAAHGPQPFTIIIYHLSNNISVYGTYGLIGYVLTCAVSHE